MKDARRWLALPLVVSGALIAGGLMGAVFAPVLGGWPQPAEGSFAAIAVVLCAYWMAPRFKLLVACAAFVVGVAVATWAAIVDRTPSFGQFPEGHPLAYEPTRLPLTVTCLGGLLALAGVGLCELRRRPRA